MRQSGCDVPEWMTKLEKPSKKVKKALQKRPTERTDIRTAAGSTSARKSASIKKREMAEASKSKKQKKSGKSSKGEETQGQEQEPGNDSDDA